MPIERLLLLGSLRGPATNRWTWSTLSHCQRQTTADLKGNKQLAFPLNKWAKQVSEMRGKPTRTHTQRIQTDGWSGL